MKKLINPFVYFSGGTTLCAGLVIMAAMVLTAGLSGQTFRGILSYGVGECQFWRLALHLFGSWAVFSLLLYAAARAFSPSKIRLVDIAGNQALAELPGLLMLVCGTFALDKVMAEVEQFTHTDMEQLQSITPSANLLLFSLAAIIVIVWFFAWSWKGFSIAANMRGWKAAGIYILCYIVAEVLASFVCRI